MSDIGQCRYKAFISYSHADEKWARWLHRSLETYRIPAKIVGTKTAMGAVPKKLAPVFRDREELASSTDLGSDLREALEQSAAQIVICSVASAKSHWVNEEILAYKRLGRSDRIFCLIVDGEPYASKMPGREAEECFPPALHYIMGADGELTSTPAEPIAADARPGKDGKSHAKIKLIAGLLGVGFDALRQRELQRRNRRMAVIAGFSVAGMLFAATLATTAILARNEAERQRARAENEAETARQTSSFLISLFQVSDPGESRGRSVTAREILTAGASRIEDELDGQPEVQTRLMTTIGRVYTNLGLYDDARGLLDAALVRRRDIPDISDIELTQSLVSLGEVTTFTADFEEAERLYTESLARLTESGAADSEQMAQSLAGLAEVYYQTGRYEEAEPLLRQVLEHRQRNLGANSAEVADAMEELGLNQFDQGNLEAAEERLRESLALRRELLGNEPHPDIAENVNNLAVVLMRMGSFEESESLYREAMEINRRLYGEAHPNVAMGLNNLGQIYREQGRLDEAENAYLDALAMQRRLLGNEHPNVAVVLHELAFLNYDRERMAEAIEYTREGLAIQQIALGREHPEVAANMSRLGRWMSEAGDIEAAEPLLREAMDLSHALLEPGHPDIAFAELGLADVLTRTGELEEARALAAGASTVLNEVFGEDHWIAAVGTSIHGNALLYLDQMSEAEPLLTGSYDILREAPGARPVYVRIALERVVALYERWNKPALASSYRRRLETLRTAQSGP